MSVVKTYGYARVSTREQNESRQVAAFAAFGLNGAEIFVEKQSGKDFERPVYKKIIRKLRKNDVFVIKSIDRLGRNYAEILEQWRVITKGIGAFIVVLDMPLLDTRVKNADLTGVFVADLVLQILSYAAETERLNTRVRQAEGIAAAKKNGVKFGRPRKERPAELALYADKWINGELTCKQAAIALGLPRTTFRDWAKAETEDSDTR